MSAHFAILRTAKLKSFGNVGGSLSHTYRTRETTNADPQRADLNEHSHSSPGEVMQALRDRLPEKYRKDAVIGLEYFVGASPQWFQDKTRQQQDDYFRQSINWLEKRHGKENVVGWSIHRDESSPHLVAYVVPMSDRGTLNAKQWTGGAAALSKMQTEFAKTVGSRNDLERGIEGSKAHHQSIKSFYAQIEKPAQHVTISPQTVEPKILKKGFLSNEYETPETVAQRVTAEVRKAYAPAVEKAKLAASEARRADEMTLTAKTLAREKKELTERLNGLERHLAPVMELAKLAKHEFAQLVLQTQERVNAIKVEHEKAAEKERVRQEQQRRIDDLVRVERKTAGAAHAFATHALEAIRKAGGNASKVEWPEVEKVAIYESITQHRQDPKKVLSAIVKHSPGMVDQARQDKARAFISTLVGKEIAPLKVSKEREGPSLG
ncbi:MobV family relaxase [Massilia genomosp. 1]|uniref:Plasmid recombination enzyme n=1 Tax=Massilia genomosp. 1 TaxID=2609280 RepID=A0ABX0MVZ3_9BURK|nr:MobV family relaxase [Massilia genomosp. 1]NHZ66863.1 plasmid recombination enzyme [Massilia genomosp. 1]